MAEAIEIRGLTKRYTGYLGGTVLAVDNLNIEVHEGEIFGFLGPNGAGKTTTMKMLLGLLNPTSGKASILGRAVDDTEVRHRISYLPENPYFYEHMTGPEVLDFYAQLFGYGKQERKERVAELLEVVGLKHDVKKRLAQYSKGMMQRIGIAQALINDPELLFFDEPTSGLDPIAHRDISELILRLKSEKKTVFLSSHQLADVEAVADRVAIIDHGKLQKIGALEELLAGKMLEVIAEGGSGIVDKLKSVAVDVSEEEGQIRAFAHDQDQVFAIVEVVKYGGAKLVGVIPQRRRLEDLFIETIREAIK